MLTTLTNKLHHVRRTELRAQALTGAINALAGLVALVTLLALLEFFFRFGVAGRTVLFWGAGVAAVVVLGRTLLGPVGRLARLLPGQSDEVIAARVGGAIPAVGDRLLNLLQLHRDYVVKSQPGVSGDLAGASIARTAGPLLEHDFGKIIDRGERRRSILLLVSASALLTGLFFLSSGEMTAAWERIVDHRAHYQTPAPFQLSVLPGDVEVERGEDLVVQVVATGIAPEEVFLMVEDQRSGREQKRAFERSGPGRFELRLRDIREDLRYRAVSGGVETSSYGVTVVEPIDITNLEVRLFPPKYSRLERVTQPIGVGDVRGLRGTVASISAKTTSPLAATEIVQILPSPLPGGIGGADTVVRPMALEGNLTNGQFSLLRDGEYFLRGRTEEGELVLLSPTYRISVQADRPPTIRLLQPRLGLDVDESNLVPVQVRISDDYGFRDLRIVYRLVSSRYSTPWRKPRTVTMPLRSRTEIDMEVPFLWDMTPERFMPEDEVEAYVEVLDNDPFLGPKSAKSSRFLLRYPSFDDILEESEKSRQGASDQLGDLMKDAEKGRREMERLHRELAKQLSARQGKVGWGEKQKLKELMQKHEEMQGRLSEVAENLKEMARKLRDVEAMSPETMQEYQELQKLFEQVENRELRRSMEKLQEEMEKMSPEEMMEAMKNFEFNEEAFRKSLERTRKRLEQMKQTEEVGKLAGRARELADEQERVNDELRSGEVDGVKSELLEAREWELARKTSELQRDAASMGENLEEMRSATEQLARENPAAAMQEAAQSIARNRPEQASQSGERAEESLREFSGDMEELAKEMSRNRGAEQRDRMEKSLKELLELAKRQQELQQESARTPSGSEEMRDQARQQSGLKQALEQLIDQTGSPDKPSFTMTPEMAKQLGDAMNQMEQAQKALEDRQSQKASSSQGKAVESMAGAAEQMAGQLEAAQQGEGEGEGGSGSQGEGEGEGSGSGSSLRSQIQQLAAQQQALSIASRSGEEGSSGGEGGEGASGGGGDGSGEEEKGGEGRLGREQREIGKSLRELAEEARDAGGGRKSAAESLERAAEEIEAVLADLGDGTITPETRARQDKIMSRLLDALKSSRERDYDEERESSPGVDISRSSPGGPDSNPTGTEEDPLLPNAERRVRYAPEYREMIRLYLESLR